MWFSASTSKWNEVLSFNLKKISNRRVPLFIFNVMTFFFQGDSGGPMIADGIQIGITSHGPQQCEEGGVYTRVSAYINNGWIASKMNAQ